MTKKNWLTLFLFLMMCSAVLFGGLFLSNLAEKSYRNEIDKNGMIVKAVIYKKISNSKGRAVFYKYWYKNKKYFDEELGRDFYNRLNYDDTIYVKIDTLNPDNSYITEY